MHLIRKSLVTVFFVAVAGCAGSTPNAKTSDAGTEGAESVPKDGASTDTKQAECNAVKAEFDAMDDAAKQTNGTAGTRLSRALEKMTKAFKESPPKTPGLDKATAELVTEAEAVTAKLKELEVVFAEMEKVNEELKVWQSNVEKSAEEFEQACTSAGKAECDKLNAQVSQVPQLEGDQFIKYADELEPFVRNTEKSEVSNANLRAALKKMLAAFGTGVKPMRRLGQLSAETQKLDPAAGKLKAKLNQVREICGLPVRK